MKKAIKMGLFVILPLLLAGWLLLVLIFPSSESFHAYKSKMEGSQQNRIGMITRVSFYPFSQVQWSSDGDVAVVKFTAVLSGEKGKERRFVEMEKKGGRWRILREVAR